MPAFLVPLDEHGCLVPLEKAIVLIGRQSDCDVVLTSSRKVSRKHCCVAQVDNYFVVRDLGSTNGITINGGRIRKEAKVKLGDVIAVGDVLFRFQAEPQSRGSIPAAPAPAASKQAPVPYDVSGELPVVLDEDDEELGEAMQGDFLLEPSVAKFGVPVDQVRRQEMSQLPSDQDVEAFRAPPQRGTDPQVKQNPRR